MDISQQGMYGLSSEIDRLYSIICCQQQKIEKLCCKLNKCFYLIEKCKCKCKCNGGTAISPTASAITLEPGSQATVSVTVT